jgi:hypothetical protein
VHFSRVLIADVIVFLWSIPLPHSLDCFHTDEAKFPLFFKHVLDLQQSRQMNLIEKTSYILFLTNCFQSIHDPMIRNLCLSYVLLDEEKENGRG